MKKICVTISSIFVMLSVSLLVACHDVIFDEIRNEVELSDAQVSGDINSIVRYTMGDNDYLFVQNGNIYYKDVTHAETEDGTSTQNPTMQGPYEGQWVQASKTGIDADHIIRLAADSTYLYALGGKIEPNNDSGDMEPTKRALYYSEDGNTWEEITALPLSIAGTAVLFCTNAVQKEHRKAFFRYQTTLYELNGSAATDKTADYAATDFSASTTTSTDDDGNETTTATSQANSCTYFTGSYYFSGAFALGTNETPSADATVLYQTSGTKIAYTKDISTWTTVSIDTTVYSLAYTSDYILAGTGKGLLYVNHADGEPTDVASDQPTNASSTLSSYYQVYSIVAVNTELSAGESDMYGTTVFSGTTSSTGASSDNVGLWAYYPGRGNWNRE